MSWKMLVVLLTLSLLFAGGNAIVYSALRMCDSTVCEIGLTYYNSTYNLTIPIVYQQANPTITFCIRGRLATNGTNGTCYLNNFDKNYNCLHVEYLTNTSLKLTVSQADPTLVPINGSTSNSSSFTYAMSASTTSIDFSSLLKDTIYETVVGNSKNLATETSTKLVFFHTFRAASTITYSSPGLFMQRYYQCYQYYVDSDYNYNLIFYGGVVRAGADTMFISFLSYLSKDATTVDTTTPLNIWGGLGFSTSHASRDMVGFSSGLGYTYDLYSLYAAGPFNDTSSNINGTNDYIQIFTSNDVSQMPTFIAAGGYRAYNTQDTLGDEIIRKKIDNKFCYAVAYSTSTTVPIEPTGKVKHSFIGCWNPNIIVWEEFLSLRGLLFIVLSLAFLS